MPVQYVQLEEARASRGLRMVVVSGVPSPWGEAAKGILHVKQIPWTAVRLDPASDDLAAWTGERSGPVVMLDDEAPRSGWAEILLLAERLAPKPALLPEDANDRALMFGLSHEICGEMGLGWARRLAAVHTGLRNQGGFPAGVAGYLAQKYGYREAEGDGYGARVVSLLEMLAQRLHAQRDAGSAYYLGTALTALDIYGATFSAVFSPLPQEHCAMPDAIRAAFESTDDATARALDPILLEHRDFIYAQHLELPLSL
jgi:glutathione S-transferase